MGKHGSSQGGMLRRLIGAAVIAVLGIGSAAGGALAAQELRVEPPAEDLAPRPAQLLEAAAQPEAALAAAPRTCSVDGETADPAALDFHGLVLDNETGEVLFQRDPTGTHPTASVMKLITTTSALVTLGPDTRIPTRVYPGDQPGSVVIVGGGDPTLKSSTTSYYSGATASVLDLAAAVQGAGGATAVGYDSSVFGGEAWHPSWNDSDRRDGYVTPITGLMTDAGRENPAQIYSERSRTPDQDAAAAFADALGASVDPGIGIEPGSEPIAEVWSQPVSELVDYVLLDSDNVVAEALARLVAIERGTGNTFDAISEAADASLAELGVEAPGFHGADGSGLSRDNRASSLTIIEVLQRMQEDPELAGLMDLLPRNRIDGTLKDRLPGVTEGAITAKTGWIDQVYSLAGTMEAEDGTELLFAIFTPVADSDGSAKAGVANRNQLDAIATAVWHCGGRLSNY